MKAALVHDCAEKMTANKLLETMTQMVPAKENTLPYIHPSLCIAPISIYIPNEKFEPVRKHMVVR
jgi:HD superfamily phosphohydrolase YqeK